MNAFIEKILPGAKAVQDKYGVLVSLTLAQACLESGWGKASIGNNIFGIKAGKSWTGKTQTVQTTEYYNGVKTSVQAAFRDYDSIQASIEDHAKLLTLPRYKPVLAAEDYKTACEQVQKCGYATDPAYAKKLIAIIEKNQLQQWDTPQWERDIRKFASDADTWINAATGKGPKEVIQYLPQLLTKAKAYYQG